MDLRSGFGDPMERGVAPPHEAERPRAQPVGDRVCPVRRRALLSLRQQFGVAALTPPTCVLVGGLQRLLGSPNVGRLPPRAGDRLACGAISLQVSLQVHPWAALGPQTNENDP